MKNHHYTKLPSFLLPLLAAAMVWPVPRTSAADVTWTNAAGDFLWSTTSNWDSNAAPSTLDRAIFSDTAGFTNVAGAVNNIVDVNKTVIALRYAAITNTGQAHYHTTLLKPGVTLTADSVASATAVELEASSGINSSVNADKTFINIIGTGGATVAVGNLASPISKSSGNGPDIWVMTDSSNGQDAKTVLDMSQLDNFTFAGSYVAVAGAGGSFHEQGTLILAKTNFIKALQPYVANTYCGVFVGAHRSGSFNSVDIGDLQLGLTNTIWTDAFEVAIQRRNTGTVEFQSSLLGSSPSLFMRGTTGANRVTKIMIGDQSDQTASLTAADNINLTGTVDFTGGTVDIMVGTVNVGRNSALPTTSRFGLGIGTLTFTGGKIDATTLNLGAQAANNRGNATGTLNVRSNASLIVNSATIGQDLGSASGTGNGTLNIAYGGQVTISNAITDGTIGTSAINVTNGTLHIGGSVTVDNLTLDGGKLHYLPGNVTDISGTAPITFAVGGATVDTDINNVTLASAIGNSGIGSLTKLGSGRLILSGANTYTGGTTISNGTLRVSNSSGSGTGSGAVTVTTTGTLDGTGSMAGPVTVNGTLSPGASAGTITMSSATFNSATVNSELGSNPAIVGGGMNDLIAVGGNLTLNGVTTINAIPLGLLGNSTNYTLFTYGGTLTGNASNLLVTNPSPRLGFTVVDPATTTNSIQVAISGILSGSLLWHGASAVQPTFWDSGTSTNWLNSGNPDRFFSGDPVALDDSALTNIVTLVGSVQSSLMALSNNSTAYAIGGSGSLAVSGPLNAQGTGSLVVSNAAANSFNGVNLNAAGAVTFKNNGSVSFGNVSVSGGSALTVANNGANTYGTVAVAGTLSFSQPVNTTATFAPTGSGALAQNGTNVLTLAGNSSGFNGTMTVNNGVLREGAANCLGGAGLYITGGSLDINGIATTATTHIYVQGAGYNGLGALFSDSFTAAPFALTTTPLTLTGDTTLRADPSNWEMRNTAFTGGGFKLTKIGTNEIDFGGNPGAANDLGDVDIKAGNFSFENNASLGLPTSTITVRSNATLGFYANGASGSKLIVMEDTASLQGSGPAPASTSEFGGTVTLSGTNHVNFHVSGQLLTCDANVTGNGGLSLDTQGGTFALGGANNFSGGVVINGGALRLANNLALSNNQAVVVHTIPVSGAGANGSGASGFKVPHIELTGGVVIPPGVTLSLDSAGTGDWRTSLVVPTGDVNEFQGAIIPHGDGNIIMVSSLAGSRLILSGPITNTGFTLPGGLAFQGSGGGVVAGQVNINVELEMNPTGAATTWTFTSTGNHWTSIRIDSGVTAISNHNALCTSAPVLIPSAGKLDLGGFNQTVPSLNSGSGAQIGSSGAANSVLTINDSAAVSVINSPIVDVLGAGSGTVALTITNSTVRLNGASTCTGPTLVQNHGTLGGTGSLASPVTVESGGTLSPGASIGTLTINNTLTLSTGCTNFFEVDAAVLANDMVSGLASVTYHGTLVISNTSATPFANGNSFQLFNAGSYSGAFDAISPPTPGAGLVWDASTLASDGTLRVAAPAVLTASVTGSTLSLNWPPDKLGWFAQSNSVSLVIPANWHDIPGSQTGTNLSITIVPTQPKVFFRLRSP